MVIFLFLLEILVFWFFGFVFWINVSLSVGVFSLCGLVGSGEVGGFVGEVDCWVFYLESYLCSIVFWLVVWSFLWISCVFSYVVFLGDEVFLIFFGMVKFLGELVFLI